MAWFEDFCTTDDGKNHYYRAAERHSTAGVTFILTFEEFGEFASSSEEDAIFIFKEWYKQNVKTEEPDLRDKIWKPSVRDKYTDLR